MSRHRNRLRLSFYVALAVAFSLNFAFLPAFHTCDPLHGVSRGAGVGFEAITAPSEGEAHEGGAHGCSACLLHSEQADLLRAVDFAVTFLVASRGTPDPLPAPPAAQYSSHLPRGPPA
jgi:hypothetical protein